MTQNRRIQHYLLLFFSIAVAKSIASDVISGVTIDYVGMSVRVTLDDYHFQTVFSLMSHSLRDGHGRTRTNDNRRRSLQYAEEENGDRRRRRSRQPNHAENRITRWADLRLYVVTNYWWRISIGGWCDEWQALRCCHHTVCTGPPSSHRYVNSCVIWDHTVLPAAVRGDVPIISPAKAGTLCIDPEGMKTLSWSEL